MYIEKPMKVYLADAASNKPAPGGGSVSALVGALGAAMGRMAANFTIGKDKFKDVEQQVIAENGKLEAAGAKFISLMQADVDEYAKYDFARTMPKDTEEQKAKRNAAMQEALKSAMAVPLEACRQAVMALEAAAKLVDIANPFLITDVGVCAICAFAAFRGAKYNVAINLQSIKDEKLVAGVKKEVASLEEKAKKLHDAVVSRVDAKVK